MDLTDFPNKLSCTYALYSLGRNFGWKVALSEGYMPVIVGGKEAGE